MIAPGIESLATEETVEVTKSTNDFLAEAIEHHPKRFAVFAAFLDQLPVSIDDLEKIAHVNAEMLLHL